MDNSTETHELEVDLNCRVIHGFSGIDVNELKNEKRCYISFNIRSMRLHWSTFCLNINHFINELDVIILVETNIKDEENGFYQLDGFQRETLNRSSKKRGGGIIMFIRNNINHQRVPSSTISFESIKIQFTEENKTTNMIAIYRPPGFSKVSFIEELGNDLKEMKKNEEYIVMGDINIDVKKSKLNISYVKDYLEMLSSSRLLNVITKCTRIDPRNGTKSLIDHILVSKVDNPIYTVVIENEITDHYPTLYYIKTERHAEKQIVSSKHISNYKLNQLIREENWSSVLKEENAERMYNTFASKLKDLYMKSTVIKKISKTRKNNPWITSELIADCKKRDILYRKWKNNINNKSYENDYKILRNKINKAILIQKSNFYKNQFMEFKTNPRKTWGLINEILGRKKSSIDDTITKNFKIEFKSLANEFGEFFSSQTANIIHQCDLKTSIHTNIHTENTIFTYTTNDSEVNTIINALGVHKSPGIDGIRSVDIKNNADLFAPILCKIINLSLTDAKIPKHLKTAVVRPIYKSGLKNQLTNYRPISILPVLEKCLEGVVVNRLQSFIEKHSLINKSQYGFQKNKNTGQLLCEFANCINESLNKGHNVLVLFMDFSKAFDTLNHSKLLEALARIGIRGRLADWMSDYLHNRKFSVKIKDVNSEEKNVEYGVPQGSNLGPLMFILYTNELLRVFKLSIPFAFADDTAIVVRDRSLESATMIMQNEFDAAVRWCHDNGLVINASKTKLMHIRSPHVKKTDKQIYFRNDLCPITPTVCIEVVELYKYLGVVIDCHFLWDKHIDKLRTDLKKSLYALSHLKYHATEDVLRQVYYALVESKLRYGILAWGNAAPTHINKLQKLQNSALRIIQHNNRQQAENKFRVLKVEQIFKMTTILEYHGNNRFIRPIQHHLNTRQRAQGLLQIPRHYNTYGKRQLAYVVPTIINSMPQELKQIQNYKTRKKQLKYFFLNDSSN